MLGEIVSIATSRGKLCQFLSITLYRNAFYLILNNVVMSLLGFFFWMVVARFYTEVEVGFSAAILEATYEVCHYGGRLWY